MTAIARIIPAEPANLILDQAGLVTAFTNAAKIVPKNPLIPILGCVKVEQRDGGVDITGTDQTLFVRTFVRGHAPAGMKMTLNPHRMLQILKKVPKQNDVKFVPNPDGSYSCFAGGIQIGLNQTPDVADFPDCTAADRLKSAELRFSLPSADVATAFERLNGSVSLEETRYYLNGVFIRSHPSLRCLEMASTDGHRLTRYRFPEITNISFEAGAIMPRAFCRELGRIAARADVTGDIAIVIGDRDVSATFSTGETLVSGLVDGTFPDFERVIPTKVTTKVTLGAWNLIEAVGKAAAITSSIVGVKLTVTDHNVACTITDPDIGTSTVDVAAESTGSTEVGVNRAYLKEMLEPMERSVRIDLHTEKDALLIHDLSDERFTGVLMPMKV